MVSCYAQTKYNRKSFWQVHAFEGFSYASPKFDLSTAYPSGAYKAITEPRQSSSSIGVSVNRPWKRNFSIEYGIAWQRFNVSVVFDPFDLNSGWGGILEEHTRYDFLQTFGNYRKDYFITKRVFASVGLGIGCDFLFADYQKDYVRVAQNQYQYYESNTTRYPAPFFNLHYNLFIGIGVKSNRGNAISLRASLQNLFMNDFDRYNRNLNAKGLSLIYAF